VIYITRKMYVNSQAIHVATESIRNMMLASLGGVEGISSISTGSRHAHPDDYTVKNSDTNTGT
jgi:hypothetical protein